MALEHSRLGLENKFLENKSGRFFLLSTGLLYKFLPTNVGVCKPTTIFQDKLHSINVQDDQSWAFSETVQGSRFAFEVREQTSNLCWVSCVINKGGFFEITFVVLVDRHLPRFEVLAYVLPHFDALTHMVILVSSAFIFQTFAEVCYSVLVNRSSFKSVVILRKEYIFKSLLKVYYRSVFNESFKAFTLSKVC